MLLAGTAIAILLGWKNKPETTPPKPKRPNIIVILADDLAAQYPDKVKHIDSLWRQWANTHHVFPKPGSRK